MRDGNGRWLPGESGNPAGRRRHELALPKRLGDLLDEVHQGKPLFEHFLRRLVHSAIQGDTACIRILMSALVELYKHEIQEDLRDRLEALEERVSTEGAGK